MGQRQSWTRLFGIGVVICGLSLPMTEYKADHDEDGSPELLWGVPLPLPLALTPNPHPKPEP